MNRARKLILHIGFPKTGSSAIQAWLAKNAAQLARHGIAHQGFHEKAAQDAITSGNAKLLVDFLRAKPAAADRTFTELGHRFISKYFENHGTAIVSSESLASIPKPQLEWLRAFCRKHEISLSIVAYIRTIYDHCYSGYQQKVKRHGESGTFCEYAATYDNPQCRWCWSWYSVFGDALKLRSYDAARNNLISDFARQAGIDHLGLPTQQGNVNRSLTFSELDLLRRLNRYHRGILSRELSDALIYADPSARSDHLFDRQIAEDFEKRFTADAQKINEVFFRDSAEQLMVVRYPERQDRPPEDWGSISPTTESALKALCEIAVSAREQKTRLHIRLCLALARLAISSKKWDKARQYLQHALQIDPDNADANRLISRLESVQENLADET